MTTHVTIGEKDVLGLSNTDLAALLQSNRNAFRSGTLSPDMALGYFQWKGGSWESNSDTLSHGATNGSLGLVNEYLMKLQTDCPSLDATAECQEAASFFFGVINHLVGDSPWHVTYIWDELKNNCAPGVTDYERWHPYGDNDTDMYLAKELNNFPAYSYFTGKPGLTGEFAVDLLCTPFIDPGARNEIFFFGKIYE